MNLNFLLQQKTIWTVFGMFTISYAKQYSFNSNDINCEKNF